MAKDNGADPESREPTRRVVLSKVLALVIPAGTPEEQIAAASQALNVGKRKAGEPVVAWLPCGVFEGASKRASIEAYAGKAGTPDAKVGVFKAPTESAWKGGREHVAPPRPLIQAREVE